MLEAVGAKGVILAWRTCGALFKSGQHTMQRSTQALGTAPNWSVFSPSSFIYPNSCITLGRRDRESPDGTIRANRVTSIVIHVCLPKLGSASSLQILLFDLHNSTWPHNNTTYWACPENMHSRNHELYITRCTYKFYVYSSMSTLQFTCHLLWSL